MPEGPEIRRAADRIATILSGEVAEEVYLKFERLQCWRSLLEGHAIVGVESRGKAMLIHSAAGITVYSHNQLYGRWYTHKRGARPPKTTRDLRLQITNRRGTASLYSASEIHVMLTEDVALFPPIEKLGPDLLSAAVDDAAVLARLSEAAFQGRALGGLFLDQRFLCGPGNYLRSEILFVAGLHPRRKLGSLSDAERLRLAQVARSLTVRAYKTGGITADAALVARLKAKQWSRRRHRHYVFARAGSRCHRCKGSIAKESISSRRIYICARCQPRTLPA
ncbi:MAG: endonuclease VIII [Myxococcota bacterium]|nr:endonuclease VIII [Myxococcota bacterium]